MTDDGLHFKWYTLYKGYDWLAVRLASFVHCKKPQASCMSVLPYVTTFIASSQSLHQSHRIKTKFYCCRLDK
jgi:hypothetical protein